MIIEYHEEYYWLISYDTLNESFGIERVEELPEGELAIGWFEVTSYDEFDRPYREKRTYVKADNINSAFAKGTLSYYHCYQNG